jgi:competence protein ComEA
MSPSSKGALARVAARAIGSRFAKPLACVAIVAAGLPIFAVIGHSAVAGARSGSGPNAAASAVASVEPQATSVVSLPPVATAAPAPVSTVPPPAAHASASPDDPVILNTASADDLRRLPGIGEKRASAILALRSRLGRFHAIEDLLKVKGVGRATLKRLRPLVRLDAPPTPDAGASRAP